MPMKKRRKSRSSAAPSPLLHCVRSAVLASVATALLVLLFAFLLKWGVLHTGSILTVNSIIKALCACAAGVLAARSVASRGWLYGGLSGCLYIAFSYVAFSLIEREFQLSLVFLSDVALGFVCGAGAALMLSLFKTLRTETG